MFWRKKKCTPPPLIDDPVVDAAKKRTHTIANKAKEESDRLNKEFAKDDITLNILRIARGGK